MVYIRSHALLSTNIIFFAAAHVSPLLFFTNTHPPQKHFLFGWNYAPKKNKAGAGAGGAGAAAAAGGKGGARMPNKAPAAAAAAAAARPGGK